MAHPCGIGFGGWCTAPRPRHRTRPRTRPRPLPHQVGRDEAAQGLGTLSIIVNVAGESVADYVEVVRRLDGVPGVAGIELNISCPNVRHGGVEFGNNAEMSARVVAACRAVTTKPIIAKLKDFMRYKGQRVVAKVVTPKFTGAVTAATGGGRKVSIDAGGKTITAGISGSRTKVTVGGKAADRGAVKVGMRCTITLPTPGAKEATKVDCTP